MYEINDILKKRYAKIQNALKEEHIDVFLGTSLRSLTYAGNVYQSFAWYVNTCILIPASGGAMLVGPLSDVARIASESWITRVESWNPQFGDIPARKFEDVLIDYFKANKLDGAVIGVEGNIAYGLRTALEQALPKAKFVVADGPMVDCMLVKDEMELDYMRKVGALCTLGFETLRDNIRPGITETELVGIMEATLRKAGCTGWWVPNQAGTGEKVLLDHYPADTVIQPNHYVKAGVHATYKLYCGDICNVFALRKAEPSYVKLCKTAEDAAQKTLDAMRPGVKCNELYFVYQKYMADHGYEKCCDWYLGHGLGTAHHAPLLSPHDPTVLQKDMIVVLNSLAQVEGENSYINEVMAIITDDGHELITHNPLGLVQL